MCLCSFVMAPLLPPLSVTALLWDRGVVGMFDRGTWENVCVSVLEGYAPVLKRRGSMQLVKHL